MSRESLISQNERMRIVEMSLMHLDKVMEIELLAYPFPWSKTMFQSSISSKDNCLVLFLDDELIGYAILNHILDEAHLLNICIHPSFEGMGLGRFFLRYLIESAHKQKSVMFFLEVRVSNVRAINLYFSEGFNEVGIRKNYYPSEKGREDAMLMTLDLSVDTIV